MPEAKNKARDNGISLAISNPCFELWGLLHIQEQTAYIDRHRLQKRLAEVMPGYHHGRNPYFVKASLRGRFEDAEQRAMRLLKRQAANHNPEGNPSTGVHPLCRLIIDGGRG